MVMGGPCTGNLVPPLKNMRELFTTHESTLFILHLQVGDACIITPAEGIQEDQQVHIKSFHVRQNRLYEMYDTGVWGGVHKALLHDAGVVEVDGRGSQGNGGLNRVPIRCVQESITLIPTCG